MVQVIVDMDTSKLVSDLSPDKIKEVQRKGLTYTSLELVRQLMMNSPVDHGLLKQWVVESIDDEEAHIKTPAEYAKWVNYGHRQQPGRFIPGEWNGDRFEYIPNYKKGMVLKASSVDGRHFVEDSIEAVKGNLDDYFLKALSEVMG